MSDRPKISFKGFSDAWKYCKLGDLVTITTGKLDANAAKDDGQYAFFTCGKEVLKADTFSFNGDAILISGNGDLGLTRKYSGKFDAYQRTYVLQDFYFDYEYIEQAIHRYLPYRILNESLGGAMPYIKLSTLSDLEIPIPTQEEAQQVSSLLCEIDNLIALHQHKYDEANTLKKNMLQKLFPEKGKNVPEIRFEGFNEEWKRKKLGELYKERNERGNDSLDFLLVSIHTGVTNGEMDGENTVRNVKRSEDKSTYKHVYEGDLVFNMMRAWQGAIGVAKSEGMVSPAYISAIPNDEVYPLFMDYALRRDSVISDINNMSYGITDFRKRLYWDSFVNVECLIPSVEEQKKIYDFFNKIDMSLSLHQKRYKELTAIKKYMLLNMFV